MIIWLNRPKPTFMQRLLEQMRNGGGPQLKLAALTAPLTDAIRATAAAAAAAQDAQIREQLIRGQYPTFVVYDELDSRVTWDMLDAMHYAQSAYSPKNAIRITGV